MIENFITNINNYNKSQLDYETINEIKTYYSIYNNQITQPFHNFWFVLSNCKFKNEYNDYKILRFGLNNKASQIQKFICFFKNLSTHLEQIFSPIYPNLTIELPWKEFDNYPFIINIFASDNTLLSNISNENIGLNNISNLKSYTILFEIKNIRIIKNSLDETKTPNPNPNPNPTPTHILKFNLNMIMCQQEPELDLKSCLSNFINKSNTLEQTILNPNNPLPFIKDIGTVSSLNSFSSNNNKINNIVNNNLTEKKLITLDKILEQKSNLRKVALSNSLESNILDPEDNISIATNSYINQKNQLKKTITEEKSLLKRLGKKSKKKKDKNKYNNLEKDLEKDLELLMK